MTGCWIRSVASTTVDDGSREQIELFVEIELTPFKTSYKAR